MLSTSNWLMRGALYYNISSKWLLLLFTFYFALHIPGVAQVTDFSKRQILKVADLEGHKVRCILQDAYGFMWFGTENGLYRYDGYQTQLVNTVSAGIRLSSDLVLTLYEDRQKNLWIGTGNGLQRLSPDRKSIATYLNAANTSAESKKAIYTITQTQDNAIWCNADDGYLYRSADKKDFTRIPNSFAPDFTGLQRIIQWIIQDNKNHLWVADNQHGFRKLNQQGQVIDDFSLPDNRQSMACFANKTTLLYAVQRAIYVYEPVTNKFNLLMSDKQLSLLKNPIQRIYQDKKGFIWLITQTELFRLNPQTKHIEDFTLQFRQSGSNYFLIDNLYEDANDQLWFGNYFGVYKLNNKESFFNTITLPKGFGANPYFSTRGLLQTPDGHLWIGSYSGFFKYNPAANTFTEFKIKRNNTGVNPLVRALVPATEGNIWLATEGSGLVHFNAGSQTFTPYLNKPTNKDKSISNHNYSLLKDAQGQLWLGGYNNLYTLNPQNGETHLFNWGTEKKSFPLLQILAIHQSRDKSIWLGTDYGLYRIKKGTGVVAHYATVVPGKSKTGLSHNYINCIYEDQSGKLWLGTKGGGINVLNPENGRVEEQYTVKDGLADDKVCAILPGAENQLWISTYNGLSCLSLKNKAFRNFYMHDGLLTNEFNHGSALAGTDGNLYFGSIDGIIYFNPNKFLPPVPEPQVMLTKLVQHKGLKNKIEETALAINSLKEVKLHYQDKFFTLYFARKNYFEAHNAQPHFAYRLVGLTDEWQNIGAVNYIQLAGLPAGQYTLSIKTIGSNGLWGKELSLPVLVGQAFYLSIGAYLLYGLVVLAVLGILFWFQLSRIRLQNKLALEQVQKEKLEELNQLKNQFFTNITHEFRTPLTLIIGPLEQLRAQPTLPPAQIIRQQHSVIYRNAQRLLRLISQLLDLAKLEAGSMDLTEQKGEIVAFVGNLIETFRLQAQKKNILLQYNAGSKPVECLFDAEKLENIIYNLLSNAFKFTSVGGTVQVDLTWSRPVAAEYLLELRVRDTGMGIPAPQLPFVFNRFYQVNDIRTQALAGSGVGLSLVKELTELMGGHVEVESQENIGTTFKVKLPLRVADNLNQPDLVATLPVIYPEEAVVLPNVMPVPEDAPLILVVEDHDELRAFILQGLADKYRVLMAIDGAEGWQLAQQELPNLVIADVSMPQMDGFTLSKHIKNTPLTSHIPVILLTARTSLDNRVQGLTAGANDYLTKPFNLQELQLRVANWLSHQVTIRQFWYREFSEPAINEPGDILQEKPAEDPFLLEVYQSLDRELANPNLDIEQLANEMNVSTRTLHRKLSVLTGMNANTLIRSYRLNKAAALLQEGYSVSEVADLTGFEGLSYFSKCFKEQFSLSPSHYASSQMKK